MILVYKRSNLFLYVRRKYEKDCLSSVFHSWNKFMLHILNKTNTINKTIHDLFLYFKICYVKKIRSVSKEDTNQFLIYEKFKFASNEDADLFLI